MECYLAPNNTLTIDSVVAARKERPRGAKLFLAGDFNFNLADPEGDRRGEDIAAGYGDRWNGRYVGALTPVQSLMVTGREDMEHDPGGIDGNYQVITLFSLW